MSIEILLRSLCVCVYVLLKKKKCHFTCCLLFRNNLIPPRRRRRQHCRRVAVFSMIQCAHNDFSFHDGGEVVWAALGRAAVLLDSRGAWTARWGAKHKQKPPPPVTDVRCERRGRCLYIIVVSATVLDFAAIRMVKSLL